MIAATTSQQLDGDGVLQCTGIDGTLVVDMPGYQELKAYAEQFAASEYVAGEQAKLAAGTRETGRKDFVIRDPLVHGWPEDHPIMALAKARPLLLAVSDALESTHFVLHACDLWLTVPWIGRELQWSQGWHRDPESDTVLKCFVYLRDVTEECGPFQYVLGSHKTYFDVCPPRKYVEPEKRDVFPVERIKTFCGPEGSIVLANTAGMHRGGYGSKERLTAIFTYLKERVS